MPNSKRGRATRKKAKTWVFWDIVSCPVPAGHDAHLVGSSIESALYKKGYSGPLTITALGFLPYTLKRTPDVLPALSATGFDIIFVPLGDTEIMDHVRNWSWYHQPPATLLFITGAVAGEYFYDSVSDLKDNGYTILHACPQSASKLPKTISFTFKSSFIWETLLEATSPTSVKTTLTTLARTGTHFCSLCLCASVSFESFTEHLDSIDHVNCLLNTVQSPFSMKVQRMLANKSYPNDATTMVEKQSKKRSFEEAADEEAAEEGWDRITV